MAGVIDSLVADDAAEFVVWVVPEYSWLHFQYVLVEDGWLYFN